MKRKRSRSRGITPKTPVPQKLEVGEAEYTALFNTHLESMLAGTGLEDLLQPIGNLSELPSAIGTLEPFISDAREIDDVDTYYRLVSVRDLLRKLEYPHKEFRDTAQAAALQTWMESEAACKEVNRRCWEIFQHPLTHEQAELDAVLQAVRSEVLSLVGEVPPDLSDVASGLRAGPGATLSHSRDEGQPIFKLLGHTAFKGMDDEIVFLHRETMFRELLVCSPSSCYAMNYGVYGVEEVTIDWVDHSVYQTVPKTILTDRSIEIGPSLATMFQKAYDDYFRRRLHSQWGVDLSNQLPNQQLAFQGSIPGKYTDEQRPCTIDMSSASDRIPFGVIAMVFSPSWVRTLSRYRAKYTLLPDGSFHDNEKFSSMGNALTFSLQTILFSAVVRSVLRDLGLGHAVWRVYGDDIIVPSISYNEVVRRLELLGGVVNVKKSFNEGNFRESCGADYLNGIAVRPLFIKKPIKSFADVFKYLNLIQTYATSGPIPATRFAPLYRMLLSWVPKEFRLYGETHCDLDTVIWVPYRCCGKFILATKKSKVEVPEKLGYLRSLWVGSADAGRQEVGPFGLPAYYRNGALVVRRAGLRIGRPALSAQARGLMLDPLLLG
jgi:hypothetical protein